MEDPIAFAVRIVRPALLLAPTAFVEDTLRWLAEWGIDRAVAEYDTAAIYDWIVPLLSFQGIGDVAAMRFAARYPPVTWHQVDEAVRVTPRCPRLRSYWHYSGCGYRKGRATCAEPDRLAGCFVPTLPLRKGSLNEAATSLYLFLRDACGGDFVGWLDNRLAAADPGPDAPGRGRALATAVVELLCHVAGTGPKVWSMVLAALLLAGDPQRERWRAAGAAMIVVDSLAHNFLHRTGIMSRFAAEHRYGPACYARGGCAEVIETIAAHVDAREFSPAFPACFPRLVAKAIWWFCAEAGRDICNGRRIDDRQGCRQVFCPNFPFCDRLPLAPLVT